jgi:hypothetical protein
VNVKSRALRAIALASSLSVGVFLVARANTGCSSEPQGVAQPEAPLPAGAESASTVPSQSAATTVEEQFLQGSKAPAGTGLRPPAPAASPVINEEDFMGGSKSGPLIRPKPSPPQNVSPPEPQKK